MEAPAKRSKGAAVAGTGATPRNAGAPCWPLRQLKVYETLPDVELRLEVVAAVMHNRIELLKLANSSPSSGAFAEAIQDAADLRPFTRPVYDDCGHALLRIMCTADKELAEFFVEGETKLFRWRLETAGPAQMSSVACSLGIRGVEKMGFLARDDMQPIASSDRLPCLGCGGLAKCRGTPQHLWDVQSLPSGGAHIAVPFEDAVTFIRRRTPDVILRAGTAYLPPRLWASFVVSHYKRYLTKVRDGWPAPRVSYAYAMHAVTCSRHSPSPPLAAIVPCTLAHGRRSTSSGRQCATSWLTRRTAWRRCAATCRSDCDDGWTSTRRSLRRVCSPRRWCSGTLTCSAAPSRCAWQSCTASCERIIT